MVQGPSLHRRPRRTDRPSAFESARIGDRLPRLGISQYLTGSLGSPGYCSPYCATGTTVATTSSEPSRRRRRARRRLRTPFRRLQDHPNCFSATWTIVNIFRWIRANYLSRETVVAFPSKKRGPLGFPRLPPVGRVSPYGAAVSPSSRRPAPWSPFPTLALALAPVARLRPSPGSARFSRVGPHCVSWLVGGWWLVSSFVRSLVEVMGLCSNPTWPVDLGFCSTRA